LRNSKNVEAGDSSTHNVGALGDGRPEQRGGVDEMVQGRGVPNLPKSFTRIMKSRSINWEEQTGDCRGMRMMENVIYLFVRGVLGAEHVRAVGAEPQSGNPCSSQPLIPVV
jgi:hypothetical protein